MSFESILLGALTNYVAYIPIHLKRDYENSWKLYPTDHDITTSRYHNSPTHSLLEMPLSARMEITRIHLALSVISGYKTDNISNAMAFLCRVSSRRLWCVRWVYAKFLQSVCTHVERAVGESYDRVPRYTSGVDRVSCTAVEWSSCLVVELLSCTKRQAKDIASASQWHALTVMRRLLYKVL